MSENLVATLELRFDDDLEDDGLGDNAGQGKITLQQMTKRLDTQGKLYARCFPASGVSYTASVGSVTTGERRIQPMREGLKFSNNARVSLSFAGATNVQITPHVLMRKTKNTYGKTVIVPATNISLRYDGETNEVVAEALLYENTYELKEVPIYGSCFVSYDAEYQVLNYLPKVSRIYFTSGYSFSVGTIFAYNDVDVATLEMELDLTSSPDLIEYARVTSKIVLDAEGTHEAPHGWPGTTQFDTYSNKELDPDNSFTDERVHCIIKINSIGSLQYEDFNNGGDGYWAWFDPMFGQSMWDPQYEIKYSDPPGGAKASSAEDFKYDLNNTTWRDIFLEVDKDELIDRLSREYPGLSEGQKGGNY